MLRWIQAVVAGSVVLVGTAIAAADSVCIWPLGDSITAGWDGGYRKPLMHALAETHGLTVTTVGSQTDSNMPPGQQAHEGHGGWKISQLNDNLLGHNAVDASSNGGYWLHGGHETGRGPIKPTVITLMAGINDLGAMIGSRPTTNAATPATTRATTRPMAERSDEILETLQTRLRTLVATLDENLPEATLLLGGCIPYNNGLLDETLTGATEAQRKVWAEQDGVSAMQEMGVNHWVILFNRWICDVYVPELQKAGKKVRYVDLYAKFILPDGSVRGWNNKEPEKTNGPAAYADYGLHPNRFGYGLIAEAWAEAIVAHTLR